MFFRARGKLSFNDKWYYNENELEIVNFCLLHQSVIFEKLTSILSNLNNFHSLEVVDRVSETQFQVGENNLAVKGLN